MNDSSLEKIAKRVAQCENCPLHRTRISVVPGEGPEDAEIFFVGEAPGRKEDLQGKPFCGQAGKFLDELLDKIGLKREEVFIGNVVKCRPPGNRDPLPEEINACTHFLKAQIRIIKPKLIVTLGRYSMNYFLPNLKISRDHGKAYRKNSQVYFPVFHPAAALYRNELKGMIIEDFKKIPRLLEKIKKNEIGDIGIENKNEDKGEGEDRQIDLGI